MSKLSPHTITPIPSTGWQRWSIPTVLALTVFVAYLDRMNVSLALPLIAEQYQWNDAELKKYGSLLMSLFYFGYGLSAILLTPYMSRLGSRVSVLIIISLASLFTALGALLSQFLLLFMLCRLLLGIVEGPHFSFSSIAIRNWFPEEERSRANSAVFGGLFTAIICGPLILIPLMNAIGWRMGFLVLAAAGMLISLPLVFKYLWDSPSKHPSLTEGERSFLKTRGTEIEKSEADNRIPFHLFRNNNFRLLVLAAIIFNVISLGIMSWIPTKFITTLGISYAELPIYVALPFTASLIGTFFWSYIGDKSNIRGYLTAIAYVLYCPSIYLTLTATSPMVFMPALIMAIFFSAAYTSCEFAFAQKIIPVRSVTAGTGLFNGLGVLVGGSLGPLAASGILEEGGGHSLPLYLVLSLVAAVLMYYLGKNNKY